MEYPEHWIINPEEKKKWKAHLESYYEFREIKPSPFHLFFSRFFHSLAKAKEEYCCKKCGRSVNMIDLPAPVHFLVGCAGYGEVEWINIPYCSKCEKKPAVRMACLHTEPLPF